MAHRGNHIGTLIKPYGYKGELLLRGNADFLEELKEGMALFIEISEQLIPFFIEDFSVDPSARKAILKLEFIDSDVEARKVVSCEVYSDQKSTGKKKVGDKLSTYISWKVIDSNTGQEYVVSDYYDLEENPIMVLQKGKAEVLLPAKADYIIAFDHDHQIITANFPAGLINQD